MPYFEPDGNWPRRDNGVQLRLLLKREQEHLLKAWVKPHCWRFVGILVQEDQGNVGVSNEELSVFKTSRRASRVRKQPRFEVCNVQRRMAKLRRQHRRRFPTQSGASIYSVSAKNCHNAMMVSAAPIVALSCNWGYRTKMNTFRRIGSWLTHIE